MFYCAWLAWEYLMVFGGDTSPILRMPKGIVIAALFAALLGLATHPAGAAVQTEVT
jgi:TRAP-type C4-dicarboxylate transport system permease small subunit